MNLICVNQSCDWAWIIVIFEEVSSYEETSRKSQRNPEKISGKSRGNLKFSTPTYHAPER